MSRSSVGTFVVVNALLTVIRPLTAWTGPDFTAILDVCEATTLDDAAIRGGHLGWPTAPEDRNWRIAFEQHNGGTVRVVGWRRSAREGDGVLSCWVASGSNAHVACAFLTDRPGLLEALRNRFGVADKFEEQGDIVSAFWRRGGSEVSLTRVGMSSTLNVSRHD
jgi:hypothetical protein